MFATFSTINTLAVGTEPPSGWIWAMAIGFALICIIMMLIVLIQKPKGGGLSGAFGGGAGGGSESAFIGGRVGDVLTWSTVICFVIFLLLAMGMTWGIKGGSPTDDDEPKQEQVEGEGEGEPDANAASGDEDDTDAGADADAEEVADDQTDPTE